MLHLYVLIILKFVFKFYPFNPFIRFWSSCTVLYLCVAPLCGSLIPPIYTFQTSVHYGANVIARFRSFTTVLCFYVASSSASNFKNTIKYHQFNPFTWFWPSGTARYIYIAPLCDSNCYRQFTYFQRLFFQLPCFQSGLLPLADLFSLMNKHNHDDQIWWLDFIILVNLTISVSRVDLLSS